MAKQDHHGTSQRRLRFIPLFLLLAGCAAQVAVPNTIDGQAAAEQRRESRPHVYPPYRSREQIQAQISQLEEARDKLLLDYTEQYPAVRKLDRELGTLRQQLRMLEP